MSDKIARLHEKIEIGKLAHEAAQRAFLEAAGWKPTTELFGFSLWKRGKSPVLIVDTTTALWIAEHEVFG